MQLIMGLRASLVRVIERRFYIASMGQTIYDKEGPQQQSLKTPSLALVRCSRELATPTIHGR